MLLPLNDTEPNRYTSWPFMVMTLITLNVIVMAYEEVVFANRDFEAAYQFIYTYGSVPTLILSQQGSGALSTITHMFMHGGFFHLGVNMMALWVYGRRVEDVCGPWRFLTFYLICGALADLISTATRANSSIPGIGASGAIAGIMGAYLILFPGGRIRTFALLGFVPTFPKVRAFWLILYFLILQIPPASLPFLPKQNMMSTTGHTWVGSLAASSSSSSYARSLLPLSQRSTLMTKHSPFQTLSSRIAWACPWYRVRQDEIRLPNGRNGVYNTIEKDDAVWIVPLTHQQEIVLINSYRYTIDKWCWEVPAGNIKPNQTKEEAALAELQEEIGGTAAQLTYLGRFYTANGICDEVGHFFLATGVTLGTPAHEEAEVIQIHPKPISEVMQLLQQGQISDGPSALALFLCQRHLI